MSCRICKYASSGNVGMTSALRCTRNAPNTGSDDWAKWPRVNPDWHCGGFENEYSDCTLEGADEVWLQGERLGGQDDVNCSMCLHFQSTNSVEGEGECRFGPPVTRSEYPGRHAIWPVVYEHDWCASIKYRVE